MTNTAVVRPPRGWELGTFALLLAVGATTVLSVLYLICDLALRHALQTGGVDGVSPALLWVGDHQDGLSSLNLFLIVGYLGGFLLWRHRTRDMLGRYVADAHTPMRHWSIPAWNAAIGTAAVVTLAGLGDQPDTLDELVYALGVDALRCALRITGLVVLLTGVIQISDQVRQAIATPRPILPFTPVRAPAPVAAGAGAVGAGQGVAPADVTPAALQPLEPVPGSDGLPSADDAFWDQIRTAAAAADLALLVTTGARAHKWRLAPAGADLTSIRTTLRPGTVVTVFTDPPVERPTEGYSPVKAQEYHGFLEGRENGALWYQEINPRRIPSFLTRAAGPIRRWALYPTDDPTAFRAVVPTE
ncbi:hypothetical protein [Actinoplanes palleronii]|uniref:Uncharacterized protein n=1 Tax=Actinoplanes palleronii TaxID=113570 RepID=A0ABQ4BKD3_9ACTN|nr:hypothetical protein [Actinoplanes palleronii]GIE71131.1 hypothetical protein Apa02nite_072390 [Actinoplanes palleronii]